MLKPSSQEIALAFVKGQSIATIAAQHGISIELAEAAIRLEFAAIWLDRRLQN